MLTSMRELGAPQGSLLVASRTYQTTQSVQKKKKEIKMGINLSPISNGWVLDTRINTYLCLHFRLLVYRWWKKQLS